MAQCLCSREVEAKQVTLVVGHVNMLTDIDTNRDDGIDSRCAAAQSPSGTVTEKARIASMSAGQGADAGTVALTARTLGREIVVTAAPTPAVCTRLGQGRLVARRGGVTKRVPMQRFGCRYRGRLSVPQRGRWFVYAELKRSKATVESWIPVKVGDDQMVSDPERYAYVADATTGGLAKTVIGGALYLLMLATLAAMIVLVRRASGAIKPSV